MSAVCRSVSQILAELSADECRRICYLCGALDTHSELTHSSELRVCTHSLLCRSERVFLLELLLRVKRYDLLRGVLKSSRSTAETLLKNQCTLPEYRVLMCDVSEEMDTEDLKSLIFLLRDTLPKHKLQNVQSFLDIVVDLEKLELISGQKLEFLEQILMSIRRTDLANKIRRFQQTSQMTKQGSADRPQTCAKPQEQACSVHREPRGVCLILDCIATEADRLICSKAQ